MSPQQVYYIRNHAIKDQTNVGALKMMGNAGRKQVYNRDDVGYEMENVPIKDRGRLSPTLGISLTQT